MYNAQWAVRYNGKDKRQKTKHEGKKYTKRKGKSKEEKIEKLLKNF